MIKQPVPMGEISALLNEFMNQCTENGANSISMPDDYVVLRTFCAILSSMRL